TLAFQTQLLERKVSDKTLSEFLVLVEHAPVYTLGRGEPEQVVTEEKAKNVRWIEVGRGGKATFHGPGQLVAYPIFDLTHHGKDVHLYLRNLESAIIHLL